MIHGKVTCPKCQNHFEISLTAAPQQQARKAAPSSGNGAGDLADLLSRIDDDQLSGQANEFVTQTRERFDQYGARTKMSEKQLAWLRKIAEEQESGEAF